MNECPVIKSIGYSSQQIKWLLVKARRIKFRSLLFSSGKLVHAAVVKFLRVCSGRLRALKRHISVSFIKYINHAFAAQRRMSIR